MELADMAKRPTQRDIRLDQNPLHNIPQYLLELAEFAPCSFIHTAIGEKRNSMLLKPDKESFVFSGSREFICDFITNP